MMRYRAQRAFTLIEILIVVVILGILAAIVIPQFTSASDDAAQSSAKSHLQTVRAQIQLYKFENGGFPATIDLLVPNYLQQDPEDDVSIGDYTFTYTYVADPESGTFMCDQHDTEEEGIW